MEMAATSGDDQNNEKRSSVEWSNLPKELLPLISKRLNTTIDILHFRSTCSTWRSSTPPPSSLFPQHTLIPHYSNSTIIQYKIYHLHHPSSSASKGWIIMLSDSNSSPLLRLLDPFTNSLLSPTSPKVLNLLNFRFHELIEAYSLNEDQRELAPFMPVPQVPKVILFPTLTSTLPSSNASRMVFALSRDGKLRASKIGDEGSTVINDNGNACFDDMILHTGQLYVVDKWGTISWVDCESLKMVQFSPMLCGFGNRKRLVGYGGSLYVVDIYIEGDPDHPLGMFWEAVGVKVYRLDEEWGRWLDVKDLGDVVFVLGKDSSFSIRAQDCYGCEGNCVYLYSGGRVCAFSLENSNFKTPRIFWPCPSLFHPKFNL